MARRGWCRPRPSRCRARLSRWHTSSWRCRRTRRRRPGSRGRVADPLIYKVAQNSTEYARDFNDEQVGTNGAYQAAPGWDYVTGWGTPILTPLIQDIDGGLTPVTSAP